MSTADDINPNKDEDDLLSDSGNLNMEKLSDTITSKEVSSDVSCIDGVTDSKIQAVSKNVLQDSNMESGDSTAQNLHENVIITTEDSASKSSLTFEAGKGNNDNAASSTEVDNKEVGNPDIDIVKNMIESKKAENETEKDNLADEFEDDDLELKWEDDDCNVPTPDDQNIKDNDTELLENKTELKNDDDKVASQVTANIEEKNTEELESNLLELEKNITAKDAEMDLEEKLLEETVTPTESSVTPKDSSMEINEDELLKDDSPQNEETMEVDEDEEASDKYIEKEPESFDDQTKAATKVTDSSNNPIENEVLKNDELKENANELKVVEDEFTPEKDKVKNSTIIENIEDINEDSQDLNLSMEVDSADISTNSPAPITANHRLLKPDVMLEIPTQELIDIDDVLDSLNCSKLDDTCTNDEIINDIDEKIHDAKSTDEKFDDNLDNAGKIDDEIVDDADNSGKNDNNVDNSGKNNENNDNPKIESTEKIGDEIADDDQVGNDTAILADNVNATDKQMDSEIPNNDVSDEIEKPEEAVDKVTKSKEKEDGSKEIKNNDLEKESVESLAMKDPQEDPLASTSTLRMLPDTSDEVPDMSDSLGLLAESCRVMGRDDDDEPEDDEEGDVDDDDDFDHDHDHDESSNQMTGDHSEDSNAPHSETEPTKCEQEKETAEDLEGEEERETREDEDDGMIDKCEEDFEYNDIDIDEEDDLNINLEVTASGKEIVGDNKVVDEPLEPEIKKESEIDIKIQVDTPKPDTVKIEKDNAIETTVIKEKESTTEEIVVKKEKDDAIVPKAVLEKDKAKPVDTTSKDHDDNDATNDDVIEQPIEIETVKVSDDEEDETPKPEGKEDLPVQKDDQTENTEVNTVVQEKIASPEASVSPEKLEAKVGSDDTVLESVTKDGSAKESDKIADDSQSAEDQNKQSPKTSPSKLKNLSLASMVDDKYLSIVELGESSSEDDAQETAPEHTISQLKKLLESPSPEMTVSHVKNVTTVNIPTGIDIMSTCGPGGKRSEIVTKVGEVVISGVAKPPPQKPARLNTSEVTIKTASSSEQTLVIPETKINESAQPAAPVKPKLSLEIFTLDSDEEDTTVKEDEKPKKKPKKCINSSCPGNFTSLRPADISTVIHYDATKKKRPLVCDVCADAVLQRQQKLIAGIKNMTPLLQLEMAIVPQDLVEILDSESEDEETSQDLVPKDTIGEETAKFLEENLADLLNDTWKKHNLDARLKDTKDELNAEILKLEEESREINQMLIDCQRVTDKLRNDLYATFEQKIENLPAIVIYDTADLNYIGPETDNSTPATPTESRLSAKRKMLTQNETPAKRPAIPLGYAPLDDSKSKTQEQKPVDSKIDDDKDISVVKLSAESAPADLPPPGELSRPPLRVGMPVYAMKNAFGPWLKGKILEVLPKPPNPSNLFTSCRVKFDHKEKNNGKVLPARCIAYAEPSNVRMTIGTRLIALFKDANKGESYYSGVVAEIPNPVNSYRYLVFFDDGYAQYVQHPFTRLVCECSSLVWEEVHPFSREFVREYLMAYPERPMVRLHQGQHLKTEWDGKWWSSRVAKVDASLAQVVFIGDGRREWIYRGSTRLAPLYLELRAAERHRPRPMPRSTQPRSNMLPYVEYTRSDEQAAKAQESRPTPVALTTQQQNEEIRRQRAVAKKSTSASIPAPAPHAPAATAGNLDTVTSRVVYYTPKNAVRPYKLTPHKCSPKCKRKDVLSLKELRTYNPLAKPLLSGWERQIVRFKGQKEVMYRAPCGRRLRNMRELHRYLRSTESELPVDLFDFYHATHCLAEFVLNKCLVGKKDLSHGKENVPVPCVNYYDDSLPEFCSYNTERTPTSGVPLNLDPEFLCGCDCTDDCEDKTKCACWKMTLEGARTIGLEGTNVGYEYKRLPEPLPSGIYECNSRCKCKETCLNRVAQHPLQLKLQVFKTLNRGWGIRALNDVPKGAFLCVYAGNLLTDATANLDGLNEGDEYLAELDYIEVVEQMKEGYEEDIPEADKKLDKDGIRQEESEEESSSTEEDESASKNDKEDDDFRPGFIMGPHVSEFSKRLRKRKKKEQKNAEGKDKENGKDKERNPDEDCITISDDEETRELSSFSAKPGMGGNVFISKYRSVRTLFGEDEACYIMDAKVQGNIGRYLNHSCSPNVFVQNVFVDTHDPRFPWVAFFALSHIKAGTELTWNYNYDVGSVPGKTLYCYCEAPNCRGRLL